MEHGQVQESFSDYWDKALDEATRREVESHLAGCPSCQREYEVFQAALKPLHKLHKVEAPELAERVPALIHRRSRGRFFGAQSRARRMLAWMPMVMLGFLCLLYLLFRVALPLLR